MNVEAGKAYLCNDGLVRWVTHVSQRKYAHLLWHHEQTDVWHLGGRLRLPDLERIVVREVFAPDGTYSYCGVMGHVEERRVTP